MKTIVIGDIHGRTIWEKIVDQPFDKVIFLGDYFDTHETTHPIQQILNFNNIVTFSKKNQGKVVILVGNHDYHYLLFSDDRYSGYNDKYAAEIRETLLSALDRIDLAYHIGEFLFTHAGVTESWCEKNNIDTKHLVEDLNSLWRSRPNTLGFFEGDRSRCGEHVEQGPLWVRPKSLLEGGVKKYTQIVGHTTMERITASAGLDVIFMDTLGTSREYLEINDGIYKAVKIK